MFYTFNGETIRYEVIYKKRSSLSIQIDLYGNVNVLAPKGVPASFVEPFLEEKWDWILEKRGEVLARWDGPKQNSYEAGEKFLYLGQEFPMTVHQDNQLAEGCVKFDGKVLEVHVRDSEEAQIQQALKRFYYQKCKQLVEQRIAVNQSHFKMKPREVKITDNQKTWGTCDSFARLTFNWRLAMAPLEVIDYVVVHEMCHMVHLNHDRSFWRLVGKISPNYKQYETWLTYSGWKMTV